MVISPLLHADLVVDVDEPKLVGQKAVTKLSMKNTFNEKVESALAQVFLTDAQGKVVGQAARWAIGGSNDRPPLAPNAETTFNFVIPISQAQKATNLAARVSFSRVVLESGKLADVIKEVAITLAK
jgi:hypothetical protein